MEADRELLHSLVDRISENELAAACGYLERLSYESESVDSETAARLDAAAAESGDDISLNEIRRRLRL